MYSIDSITLASASFERELNIDFQMEIFNDVKIAVEMSKNDLLVSVTLALEVSGLQAESEVFNIKTKTIGVFNYENETIESLDKFSKINAPAIIFPFVRETIAGLSLKGALPPVILPPLNFESASKNSVIDIK